MWHPEYGRPCVSFGASGVPSSALASFYLLAPATLVFLPRAFGVPISAGCLSPLVFPIACKGGCLNLATFRGAFRVAGDLRPTLHDRTDSKRVL